MLHGAGLSLLPSVTGEKAEAHWLPMWPVSDRRGGAERLSEGRPDTRMNLLSALPHLATAGEGGAFGLVWTLSWPVPSTRSSVSSISQPVPHSSNRRKHALRWFDLHIKVVQRSRHDPIPTCTAHRHLPRVCLPHKGSRPTTGVGQEALLCGTFRPSRFFSK